MVAACVGVRVAIPLAALADQDFTRDAYDERVCGLGAHKAMRMGDALKSLSRAAGTDLDPDLVRRFDSVVRAETSSYGIDPDASPGLEDFQELVVLLQEDRGFI